MLPLLVFYAIAIALCLLRIGITLFFFSLAPTQSLVNIYSPDILSIGLGLQQSYIMLELSFCVRKNIEATQKLASSSVRMVAS